MKVTFILKDLSDDFFEGFGTSIKGLNNMADAEKFAYLTKAHRGLPKCSMKIGSGMFRDTVDLNRLMRGPCSFRFTLEPRKGYQLATFEVTAS
jgi:hypothetical protein